MELLMEDLPWRLAIDFGTSNTTAAISSGADGVRVLRLGSRSDAVPSCVAVYNGEIITGEAALQVAGIHPAAFEPTPKRRLSEDAVVLGGQVFNPVDLVAAVLRFVVGQARRFAGGREPAEVVLTHPEAWDEYMKQRLIAAAVLAGIPKERLLLLPEPVAAAWHYASGPGTQPGAYIAVLDFGGGTCDAAVLQLADTPQGQSYQVVSSDGIDPLGGHDFDAQLENWVYTQLAAEGKTKLLQGLKSEQGAADRAVLRDQIREAKHALSFHNSAPIGVRSGKHEWVCTVTRSEFEHLIARQVDRAVELVHRVIRSALPAVEELHRVYLTGGSSYIPVLQSKLGEILPLKLGLLGDPKQVTSVGALQTPQSSLYLYNADRVPPADGGNEPSPEPPSPEPRRSRKLSNGLLAVGASIGAVLVAAAIAVAIPDGPGTPPEPDGRTAAGTVAPSPTGSARSTPSPTGSARSTTGTATPSPNGSARSTTGTTTPSPTSRRTTPATQMCAGFERPDLSTDECALLNNIGLSARLIAPESCGTTEAYGSSTSGLNCKPHPNPVLAGSENPRVSLYGHDGLAALNRAFDGYVASYGAAQRPVTQPPGWGPWEAGGVKQGKILGFVLDDVSYLVWTEEDASLEMWASSSEADLTQLYEWWTQQAP